MITNGIAFQKDSFSARPLSFNPFAGITQQGKCSEYLCRIVSTLVDRVNTDKQGKPVVADPALLQKIKEDFIKTALVYATTNHSRMPFDRRGTKAEMDAYYAIRSRLVDQLAGMAHEKICKAETNTGNLCSGNVTASEYLAFLKSAKNKSEEENGLLRELPGLSEISPEQPLFSFSRDIIKLGNENLTLENVFFYTDYPPPPERKTQQYKG